MARSVSIASIILIIAISFVAGAECTRSNKYGQHTLKRVEKVYDSIPVPVQIAVSMPVSELPIAIPNDIDTAAVIEEYFKKRTYSLTHADTNVRINMKPVISSNRLDEFNLTYEILRPQTVSYYQEAPKHELYGGFQAGGSFIGPAVHWNIRNKWLIGIQYNMMNEPARLQLSLSHRLFVIK